MKESFYRSKKGFFILSIITMACWGGLYPLVKKSYQIFEINMGDIPSIILYAGLRFLVSGVILVALVSASAKKIKVPRGKTLANVLYIGFFATFLHYTLNYVSVSMIDTSKIGILKQVGSLFVIFFASLFAKGERFSPGKIIGGILGFAAIIIINLNGLAVSFALGDILIIGASFCMVAAGFISKAAYKKDNPSYIIAWSQLAGGIALVITGASMGGSITHFSLLGAGIFTLICTASMISYILWNILLKYHEFSSLSVVKFLESVFTALFSALILGENIFKWTYLVSFVLICAGIVLSEKYSLLTRRKKNPPPPLRAEGIIKDKVHLP